MLMETAVVRLSMPGGVGGQRREPLPTRLTMGKPTGPCVKNFPGIRYQNDPEQLEKLKVVTSQEIHYLYK